MGGTLLANVGAALAGPRNRAHALHTELAETDPDVIGARSYAMYRHRERPEEVIGDMDAFRALVGRPVRAR
ncbi:hypothetical protein [Streptomyces sp. PsTaAH-124]|uniref:hypothetical protein n=1 Tax=Streptomyces sp. PsTaAH-124 TaxID=1157638 RepID=UPI000368D559|nr:hypothetical protein [Streptomyces sp. PsTaAH-124]